MKDRDPRKQDTTTSAPRTLTLRELTRVRGGDDGSAITVKQKVVEH